MESIDFIFIEKCGEGNKQHISSQKKGKKKKKANRNKKMIVAAQIKNCSSVSLKLMNAP